MISLRIVPAVFLAAFNGWIDPVFSFAPQGSFASGRHSSSLGAVEAKLSVTDNAWSWNGHCVHTEVTPPVSGSAGLPRLFGGLPSKPAVLLIHGFGCSTTYWRATVSALSEAGYEVHALDLLGQGQSAKPGREQGVEYSINLWARIVDQYARENIGDGTPIVLAGNSLGSVVALAAATGDHAANEVGGDSPSTFLSEQGRVGGICMFNCGVGMNSRNVANEPQRGPAERFLINFILDVLDILIFKNQLALSYVLDKVVTRDLLRDTLKGLYTNQPERVDDELVESFYSPAKGEGSVDVLSQIYTNDPGKTPMELHDNYGDKLGSFPVHLVWGDDDGVTPLSGGVGQFYKNLAAEEGTSVSFEVVGSGHVPFDDNPTVSNASMLRWLEEVIAGRSEKEVVKEQGLGLGWIIGR
mmetsp:Transcript_59939/g.177732  ORF Transcript_59939/g.177732 Transcript_59939/m.177732 type:complete len:412 (-) Transcript_59939:92-1327(-)